MSFAGRVAPGALDIALHLLYNCAATRSRPRDCPRGRGADDGGGVRGEGSAHERGDPGEREEHGEPEKLPLILYLGLAPELAAVLISIAAAAVVLARVCGCCRP